MVLLPNSRRSRLPSVADETMDALRDSIYPALQEAVTSACLSGSSDPLAAIIDHLMLAKLKSPPPKGVPGQRQPLPQIRREEPPTTVKDGLLASLRALQQSLWPTLALVAAASSADPEQLVTVLQQLAAACQHASLEAEGLLESLKDTKAIDFIWHLGDIGWVLGPG